MSSYLKSFPFENYRSYHALGFSSLVLERCVLASGVSEDLRAAGLRAANVFMARSAKANERDAIAAGGETMHSKGDTLSSIFSR